MSGYTRDCGAWWDIPGFVGHGKIYKGLQDLGVTCQGLQDMVGHTIDCAT